MSAESRTPIIPERDFVICTGGYILVRFEDGDKAWAICPKCRGRGCKTPIAPSKARW